MDNDRYPYAYAYDYIREIVGSVSSEDPSTKLSRADCGILSRVIAAAIGMDHGYFCKKLANAYCEKWKIYTHEDGLRKLCEEVQLTCDEPEQVYEELQGILERWRNEQADAREDRKSR